MTKQTRRTLLKAISALPLWVRQIPSAFSQQIDITTPSAALTVVRLLNTMEASHKTNQGVYASLAELLHSDQMDRFYGAIEEYKNREPKPFKYGIYSRLDFNSPGIIPGWKLFLNTTDSGDAYSLTMMNSHNAENLSGDGVASVRSPRKFTYASDESGRIYEGLLGPLELPNPSYTPIRKAFPDLEPLKRPRNNTLRARIDGVVQRVAFNNFQEHVVPASHSCFDCCGCGGNCSSSSQAFCHNCGFSDCVWCCFAFCGNCILCCGANCTGPCF